MLSLSVRCLMARVMGRSTSRIEFLCGSFERSPHGAKSYIFYLCYLCYATLAKTKLSYPGKAGGLPMILDGIVENVRRKINTSPDEFEENESITYA